MCKRLRQLVERLVADPSPANRAAFHRWLVMSMVWTPLYVSPAEKARETDPTTVGSEGETLALVFTEGSSARHAYDVGSAGGESGRNALERALAGNVGLAVATGLEPTAPRAFVSVNEAASVLELERFVDPILGVIAWDPASDDKGFWRFDAGPVDGRSVAGVAVPRSPWEQIGAEDLARIRKTVLWARANDAAVRAHIAAEMWDWWYNEYSDPSDREEVPTREEFCRKLELEVIRFEPGENGYLVYADQDLVSGYGIHIHVSQEGRFTQGPYMG